MVWKLKRGVKWHDGMPFTADDVVFNWEYARNARDRGGLDRQLQGHQGRKDRRFHRSRELRQADAVLGRRLCRHLRHDHPETSVCRLYRRQIARRADQSEAGRHRPLYVRRFQAGRHRPRQAQSRTTTSRTGRYFDTIEIKGGGDAVSAARAVLQTGEYDYAWNMQVEDEILLKLESAGKGKVSIVETGNIEFIMLNVDRSGDRGRRRARQHQDQASAVQRPGGAPGHQPADRSRLDREIHLRPHRQSPPRTSSTTRNASARKTPNSNSTSRKPTRFSRPPAGKRAPTAFAPRTANR